MKKTILILTSFLFLLAPVYAQKMSKMALKEIQREYTEKFKGKKIYLIKDAGDSPSFIAHAPQGGSINLIGNPGHRIFTISDTTIKRNTLQYYLCTGVITVNDIDAFDRADNAIALRLSDANKADVSVVVYPLAKPKASYGYDDGLDNIRIKVRTDLGEVECRTKSMITDYELDSIAVCLQNQYSQMLSLERDRKAEEHEKARIAAEERAKKEAEEREKARIAAEEKAKRERESLMAGPINIIGVNTEKVEGKNDFYAKPVSLQKYMGKNNPCSDIWWGDFPEGQVLFYPGKYNEHRKIEEQAYFLKYDGDSLYVLQPEAGYYTVTGVLITIEDCGFMRRAPISGNLLPKNIDIPRELIKDRRSGGSTFDRRIENAPTYKDLQNMVMEDSDAPNRISDIRRNGRDAAYLSNGTYSALANPLCYILSDSNGNTYYTLNSKGALKVDFYKSLVDEFKGQRVLQTGEIQYPDGAMRDVTSRKVTDYFDSSIGFMVKYAGTISEDYLDRKDNDLLINIEDKLSKISFTCKDIVLDCTEDGYTILAILENNDKTATVSYNIGSYLRKYSYESGSLWHRKIKEDNESGKILMLGYDEKDAFISEKSIRMAISLNKQLDRENKEDEAAWKRKFAQEQKERKERLISKYGETYGQKIFNHELALGMTPEMCKESIGYPNRQYKTVDGAGTAMVYCYAYSAVYFVNNKLVRIDSMVK